MDPSWKRERERERERDGTSHIICRLVMPHNIAKLWKEGACRKGSYLPREMKIIWPKASYCLLAALLLLLLCVRPVINCVVRLVLETGGPLKADSRCTTTTTATAREAEAKTTTTKVQA